MRYESFVRFVSLEEKRTLLTSKLLGVNSDRFCHQQHHNCHPGSWLWSIHRRLVAGRFRLLPKDKK
jgi:hypothetical protein